MGKFKFIPTAVPGILIIEPTVFGDDRGYFLETYHKEEFAAAGIKDAFVQDNQSKSGRGVLRGLHFQTENTQGKLVRVTSGQVFDVGVDLRPGSPYFGSWAAAQLSEENKRMLYIPKGFAHGFLVLSETAVFTYKCTDIYAPQHDAGIAWNDPDVGIVWPQLGSNFILSDKDQKLPLLKNIDTKCFERWL